MLLMALPNEHLMTFNQYNDAKSLFAVVETRFGGNEATKKTQKTLLKQMYKNFSAPSTESLDSIFNRLQKILVHKDLEQIHKDNLEEMDLKWQLALLSMREREINLLKNELEKIKQEKEGIQLKFENFDNASKSLDKLLRNQITDKRKKGLGFQSYNYVLPPATLVYNTRSCPPPKTDLSYSGLEEFKQP
uniref:Ribonuclease H-like domain-containing protein n=1 Tax=Tanacetum cinerariifolium TaxID=118510 RepID=A0A699IRW2_TANCI|nr:ribonuclease H-like domain-containing protein [Tanacetum cinerariifolium]